MVDKNKLSKELEEQIQGVASEVYIQIEDKLTHLIRTAIDAETNKTASLDHNEEFESLNKNYQDSQDKLAEQEGELAKQQECSSTEINFLKAKLQDSIADIETKKQNFQVELTQNTINYTETIEKLERRLAKAESQQYQQQNEELENGSQLQEKLLENEQQLKDKKQENDGLKGRLSVLTEQEQSLLKQVNTLITRAENNESALQAGISSAELQNKEHAKALSAQKKQISTLTEQLSVAKNNLNELSKETELTLKDNMSKEQKKYAELNEQFKNEQNNKADLQQELTQQQKTLDTQNDAYKKLEQEVVESKNQVTQLQDRIELEQQKVITEQEKLKIADEQSSIAVKRMAAEQKISENKILENTKTYETKIAELIQLKEKIAKKVLNLEKNNTDLFEQLIAEKDNVKLHQEDALVLKEKVKAADEGQESILQRFNNNREKQEKNDNKVRETIKFLRDENHNLMSSQAEESASLSERINELELKLTEYRLKFEYAQKQLTS
jgi:hypothetical protein